LNWKKRRGNIWLSSELGWAKLGSHI
jgi:hypothetical protein